jgi:hypothetical protein
MRATMLAVWLMNCCAGSGWRGRALLKEKPRQVRLLRGEVAAEEKPLVGSEVSFAAALSSRCDSTHNCG